MAWVKLVIIVRDLFDQSLFEKFNFSLEKIKVVQYGHTSFDAISCYETYQPDVLVMPLLMPGRCALTTARKIKRRYPEARLVILMDFISYFFIYSFFKDNLAGLVTRKDSIEYFIKIIKLTFQDNCPLMHAHQQLLTQSRSIKSFYPLLQLTDTELDILLGLLQHKSLQQIANELRIKSSTVSSHKHRLIRKVGVNGSLNLSQLAKLMYSL